jgi:hypothetical protein
MMIQPGFTAVAQQLQDNPTGKSSVQRKKKKKRAAKTESGSTTVLPSIFAPQVVPQPAATQPAAGPQKANGGLMKPTAKPGIAPTNGKVYKPEIRKINSFAPINVREIERQEALLPQSALIEPAEIKSLAPPKGEPPPHGGAPILLPLSRGGKGGTPLAPPASPTGVSPAPSLTFRGQEEIVGVIPPDTDGAVGDNHVVTATNDRLRISNRNGTIISTVTANSFWSGVTLEGGATPSITDPRVRYDRFNDRFIFALVANPNVLSSATLIAVTATNDPTGTWFRYAIDADPTATTAGGKWADFPSIGFNKDWIVIQDNLFNFCTPLPSCTPTNNSYAGPVIYAIDKALIYTGPGALGAVPTFFDPVANCTGPIFETQLGCGFTMVPSQTEDNTTPNVYLVEDWDATAAQLRISKLDGPVAAPVLTVGTQIPQSLNSWRFNATRIGTTGGYAPQRVQTSFAVSTTARMMTNDSRLGNVVYRNGSLWTAHHVMLPTTPTAAGVQVGGGGVNPPDNHTAIQWWQLDPSIETGVSTLPTQRGRIEDPTADNCHNGANGLVATPPCNGSALNQHGTFFAFPSISVNQNNDVLIGFTQFSAFTYPSAAYAFRTSSDPLNTTRDPAVFHAGQSNDNIGGGSGTARQNRWGDYSMTQTDPLNDTDFWTTQEYTGVYRIIPTISATQPVCPWETWWALVKPSTPAPSTSGGLVISEFRLRGPQGVRDEYVDLYNPGASAIIVSTTDNSDGWALATQTTAGTVSAVAVIPNGTVIPSRGHFLIADNPDVTAGTQNLVYSLTAYPNSEVRTAESDTGWSVDIPDSNGIAIFKTANPANFIAANIMDAAGPTTLPGGSIFREGTGYGDLPNAGTLQYAMVRAIDQVSGNPKDTGNNLNDFIFMDPSGTLSTAGQRLGAPGPQNLHSPLAANTLSATLLDPAVSSSTAPNRSRDLTSDPGNNSTFGTMTIRRTFTNNSGAPMIRLRFRVVNMTTFPVPAGVADLRLRSSTGNPALPITGVNTACPGSICDVKALTLETPPAQALSGGVNSSVSAGTITLAAPLAAGGQINLEFLLGVQQNGYFQFYVYVEALP